MTRNDGQTNKLKSSRFLSSFLHDTRVITY